MSKFGQYIKKNLNTRSKLGDLANYIRDTEPSLFNKSTKEWEAFFAKNEKTIPPNIRNIFGRLKYGYSSRTRAATRRPAFAAYMYRYRNLQGPTGNLSRRALEDFEHLFMQPFEAWLTELGPELSPEELEALHTAHRRSLKNPDDAEYLQYVNYNHKPRTKRNK